MAVAIGTRVSFYTHGLRLCLRLRAAMYVQRAPLDYLWMSITRTEKFVVAGTIVSLMLVFVVFVGGEPSRIRKQV